jgi:5-methylcytosine-specific restriction enzyme A
MALIRFSEGSIYNRRQDIHGPYGGQQQGGICTPSQHPLIIIFTGESGEQHGYNDGWTDAGTYRYFGEGQIGDMAFERGNRALRDHIKEGKDLLMFQTLGRRGVRFMGQFSCCGYEYEEAPDREGDMRRAIVFDLAPAAADIILSNIEEEAEIVDDDADDLNTLRQKALEAAQSVPQSVGKEARRNFYRRSQVVRRYVLTRADGICEGCGGAAPFINTKGLPYLEPHHIRRLTDGGPDDPRFMVALCPNCHREVHHGVHGAEMNGRLKQKITNKEAN